MNIKHPIIIGIDTHKATHVAVAIDTQGVRLAALSIPATSKGYLELERWSCAIGQVQAFGTEGTGSYGACGLPLQTMRGRQLRYTQGKTDSLDARQVPLGQFYRDRQMPALKHKRDRRK